MPFLVLDPAAAAAAPVTTLGAPRTGVEGKTFDSMQDELRDMLGGRTDVEAKLGGWINDAQVDLITSVDTDEAKGSLAITTVVGQAMYLLPTVVDNIQTISLNDSTLPDGGYPLEKTDKFGYRAQMTLSDYPTKYFRERNILVLWPTPDAAYSITIDFRIRPSYMTLTTHQPILDKEWHRAIILRAREMAFDDLMEFDKAGPAENSVTRTVRRRENREANEDENRAPRSSVPHLARAAQRKVGNRPWEGDF